jgi:hypothetical protein
MRRTISRGDMDQTVKKRCKIHRSPRSDPTERMGDLFAKRIEERLFTVFRIVLKCWSVVRLIRVKGNLTIKKGETSWKTKKVMGHSEWMVYVIWVEI